MVVQVGVVVVVVANPVAYSVYEFELSMLYLWSAKRKLLTT